MSDTPWPASFDPLECEEVRLARSLSPEFGDALALFLVPEGWKSEIRKRIAARKLQSALDEQPSNDASSE